MKGYKKKLSLAHLLLVSIMTITLCLSFIPERSYAADYSDKIPKLSEELAKMRYIPEIKKVLNDAIVIRWRQKINDHDTVVSRYATIPTGEKLVYYGSFYINVGYPVNPRSAASCKSGMRVDIYLDRGKNL